MSWEEKAIPYSLEGGDLNDTPLTFLCFTEVLPTLQKPWLGFSKQAAIKPLELHLILSSVLRTKPRVLSILSTLPLSYISSSGSSSLCYRQICHRPLIHQDLSMKYKLSELSEGKCNTSVFLNRQRTRKLYIWEERSQGRGKESKSPSVKLHSSSHHQ